MLFGLDRPRPRPPLPRPPTRCGFSPVTNSASNAASRAKTPSLPIAFVASATALAVRASFKRFAKLSFASFASKASASRTHAEQRASAPLLFNCALENADAGFVAPHAAQTCVVDTDVPSDASLRFASASKRSRSSRSAAHFLQDTFSPARARCVILFENSTAGKRLRPQSLQSYAPCHCVGSMLARTPRSDMTSATTTESEDVSSMIAFDELIEEIFTLI